MHDPSPIRTSEPDEYASDKALRQATLQQLANETQRILSETRQLLAAHRAESLRMAEALNAARARLALSRVSQRPAIQAHGTPVPDAPSVQHALASARHETPGSVTMASLTFHKSLHPQVSLPQLPPAGEP